MGRVADCYTMSVDEAPGWIAGRVKALHNGCDGCAEERRERLRNALVAFEGLAGYADPKGTTAQFEQLYELVRYYVAHLTRLLREKPPLRCERHRDRNPGWCPACLPKELEKRQELLEDDDLAGPTLELALERRRARQCRHYRRPEGELQTGEGLRDPGPRFYERDCPLCEQTINDTVDALRAEVAEGRVSLDEQLPLVRDVLALRCEHRVDLGPQPDRRSDGGPARLPSFVPDVAHARSLLASTDELALADAVASLTLHMQQLDDEAFGGSPYSSVGMDFNPDADSHSTARSSFGVDAAVYHEDITEAEIHVTRHMEVEARAAAQRIFGDQFKGFNHLEGGVADVLMDADVAAARFRFDELIGPFVATTEERYDINSPADIIDRELRPQRPEGAVSLERVPLKTLLPRLEGRLSLMREWEPSFWADNHDLSSMDDARALAARWADVLGPLELEACDPRTDRPSLWECWARPDRVEYRIRVRLDQAAERGGLVLHGSDPRPARRSVFDVRGSADHAWAWDGEPNEQDVPTDLPDPWLAEAV